MMSKSEEETGPENEIPMYCCLEFSFAVYYKFITIDMERNSIKIDLKSALSSSEAEKKGITDGLHKYRESLGPCSITPDYLEIMYCPWCGLHLNHVVDFDKSDHLGQYSSKEGWER
jgi:hypothetical protein